MTGLVWSQATPDEARPMKGSEAGISPSNKLIQGDWDWFPNHNINDPRTWWHNYRGQHRFNVLFGDGHVQFYKFPEEMKNWQTSPPPDPNFTWW
ncbi:MAG: hypothetical protein HY043_17915 [Verrucomicrobia bacterium]|nr:hypothetical protein [Verrucomicrobiota bacterium]